MNVLKTAIYYNLIWSEESLQSTVILSVCMKFFAETVKSVSVKDSSSSVIYGLCSLVLWDKPELRSELEQKKNLISLSDVCLLFSSLSTCSVVGASVLRGVVVPAGHGSGGTHPHSGPRLRPAAAWTQHQVQGLQHRSASLMVTLTYSFVAFGYIFLTSGAVWFITKYAAFCDPEKLRYASVHSYCFLEKRIACSSLVPTGLPPPMRPYERGNQGQPCFFARMIRAKQLPEASQQKNISLKPSCNLRRFLNSAFGSWWKSTNNIFNMKLIQSKVRCGQMWLLKGCNMLLQTKFGFSVRLISSID